MKALFAILLCLTLSVAADAACTGSSPTWTAASASLTDVSACVTAASAGDTINVPSDSKTWSSGLTISKNVSIIGAGIGNTNITVNTAQLITGNPTNSTTNLFRISGFTFTVSGTNRILELNNASQDPAATKVRIDHNRFTGTSTATGSGINVHGLRGVADHNTIDGLRSPLRAWGQDESHGTFDWTTYGTLTFGTADNFYYEDNTISVGSTGGEYMVSDCDAAGRYVYRYNAFSAGVDMYPWLDWHGGRGVTYGCFSGEIYGNTYSRGGYIVSQRGGRGLTFMNSVSSGTGEFNIYNNDGCPDTTDQRINSTYAFLNRAGLTGTLVDNSSSGGNSCSLTDPPGDVVENTTFFMDDPTRLGAVGVGYGTLAQRPATCTTGVGYWATTQSITDLTGLVGADATAISGTLYKCTAPNTWTSYYTPYTYPHPLISSTCVPDHLTFTDQPSSALLGATLGTVVVEIKDAGGATCTDQTTTITLSKNGSATWGTLNSSSSLAKAATAGVATWTDLSVTVTTGAGSMDAAATALTGATSTSFNALATAHVGRRRRHK